jgi:hypothetical protein
MLTIERVGLFAMDNDHKLLSALPIAAGMRWDRLTFTALGGIVAFLAGATLLLEDRVAPVAPVFAMVGGFGPRDGLREALFQRVDPQPQALMIG